MVDMDYPVSDKIQVQSPPYTAFIYHYPRTSAAKEQIHYNAEAWHILSLSAPASKEGKTPSIDLSVHCERWMGLLNEREAHPGNPAEDGNPGSGFLDLYQSRRRCYGVRGIALSGRMTVPEKKEDQQGPYLFLLERIVPDNVNLSALARQWHLSHREEEIVGLLIADKSNKEMAAILGLSINTVKGYLKLLERKMGATSRCGVIARLLTESSPSSRLRP